MVLFEGCGLGRYFTSEGTTLLRCKAWRRIAISNWLKMLTSVLVFATRKCMQRRVDNSKSMKG